MDFSLYLMIASLKRSCFQPGLCICLSVRISQKVLDGQTKAQERIIWTPSRATQAASSSVHVAVPDEEMKF